ncbi:hypothetical protein [Stutzerimonas stutzeri]|uniref:hypothetical protein n=1 Tax=Stutzerimonas stutzeri TaxID=316 RepID=UPI000F8201FD|nr:hypothetical protein [Stutzerimonas stutzeri]
MGWLDLIPSASAGASPNYSQVGGFSPAIEPGPLAEFNFKLGVTPAAAPVDAATPLQPTFMQSFLGYTDPSKGINQQGWGGMAISGLSALSNAYMGMKQYGLAKEQFAESKRQYNQNYAAQRKLTNSSWKIVSVRVWLPVQRLTNRSATYMQKNGV